MPVKSTPHGGFLPRRSKRIASQKKRKCLENFTRLQNTVLDTLPLDVISYGIFPYLDYETRISLNQCLPRWDRIQRIMAPVSVKKHHTNVCVKIVSDILKSLEQRDHSSGQWMYRGDRRIQRMIQMLSLFLKEEYFYIYVNFGQFRSVFSRKIDEMQAIAYEHDNLYSRVWLDELISTCNSLRDKITSYRGELRTIKLDTIPCLSFT